MNEHFPTSGTGRAVEVTDGQVLRWLEALAPLLNRTGPLAPREAEAWRKRLPALIARGALLRYRWAAVDPPLDGSTLSLLAQTLEEARSLQQDLARSSASPAPTAAGDLPDTVQSGHPSETVERVRVLVCRSAARREIEELVREGDEQAGLRTRVSVAVPSGRAPALEGFNLCFFAFLCLQTLLWGTGLLHGAELSSIVLYAFILAPFWWWGGYLLQAMALALSPEQLTLSGRHVTLRRAWPGATELELPEDEARAVRRECWFEINLRPVHCLTLYGTNGRRARFAVARDPAEHERLLREIEEHLRCARSSG